MSVGTPFRCPPVARCWTAGTARLLYSRVASCATMASRCGSVAAVLVAILSPAVSWVTRPHAAQSAGSRPRTRTRQRPGGDTCWVYAPCPRAFPRRVGLPALRMGEAEDAIEAEVRAMRASKIKQTLEEMSIATKGVYEVGHVAAGPFFVVREGD